MRNRQGVSFVEISIGILILALALLPTFGLLIENTRGVKITADELEATNLSCCVLEAVQSVPMHMLPIVSGWPGQRLQDVDPALLNILGLPAYDNARFQIYLSVEEANTAIPPSMASDPVVIAASEMKQVVVTCTWRTKGFGSSSGFSKDRMVRMMTLVSRAVHE